MRERDRERERRRQEAWEAGLSDQDRNRFSRYNQAVKAEAEREKLPPEHYAARFASMTGKGVDTCGEMFRAVFMGLYGWTEDGSPDRKGYYLYGGTGCGKTTLARLFAKDYRVVNCVDVSAAYEANNTEGLRGYYDGNICFDDLGAEQKAFGKYVMEDVVQVRYDRLQASKRALSRAKARLEELEQAGRDLGWERGEVDDVKRCKAQRGIEECMAMCGWALDLDNARKRLERTEAEMPFTCFTSNLDYPELCGRYGVRVESRIREMCGFIDLSGEPDYRTK